MAKNDRDLFERMRQAGLRKQVAKRLSGIGEGAGRRALHAARGAVGELRSLADEIERRLPAAGSGDTTPTTKSTTAATTRPARTGAASTRSARAASTPARKTASRPARKPASGSATSRPVAKTSSRTASTPGRSAARRNGSTATAARAPRGQNKSKILASLTAGPKTASQIASETGIGARTVGSTLTKLAGSGEVVKAPRGYALPK